MKLHNNCVFITFYKAVNKYSAPQVVVRRILYEHVVYVLYSSLIHPPALVVCLTSHTVLRTHSDLCTVCPQHGVFCLTSHTVLRTHSDLCTCLSTARSDVVCLTSHTVLRTHSDLSTARSAPVPDLQVLLCYAGCSKV